MHKMTGYDVIRRSHQPGKIYSNLKNPTHLKVRHREKSLLICINSNTLSRVSRQHAFQMGLHSKFAVVRLENKKLYKACSDTM